MSWRDKLTTLKRAAIDKSKDLSAYAGAPKVTSDMVKAATAAQVSCEVYGWRILLSRTREGAGFLWHLSTSLHPKGRPTVAQDWARLGTIAAHLGAPRDPLIVPDDPNGVHHWRWREA